MIDADAVKTAREMRDAGALVGGMVSQILSQAVGARISGLPVLAEDLENLALSCAEFARAMTVRAVRAAQVES